MDLGKRQINYLDISDIERAERIKRTRGRILDLVNVPIVVLDHTIVKSQWPDLDEHGKPVLDENGHEVFGPCAIVKCKIIETGELKTFSTASRPIIRQLKDCQNHFIENKIPREYWGYKAIIKRNGRCLGLFTTKKEMTKEDTGLLDEFQSLEKAGSPITKEDCKYGSTIDEDTRKFLEEQDAKMTQLVGDPNDLANDTRIPLRQRRKYRKLAGKIDEDTTE